MRYIANGTGKTAAPTEKQPQSVPRITNSHSNGWSSAKLAETDKEPANVALGVFAYITYPMGIRA
jgi:hypothetical protein